MRLLAGAQIEAALPMPAAMRLMGEACRAIAAGRVAATERQVLALGGGHALLMGACDPGVDLVAKLVGVIPGNHSRGLPVTRGLALLFDAADGTARAVLEATALTAWRTAAVVGYATDLLAAPAARRALLVGCGSMARAQALALDAARTLDSIEVAARDPARVAAFIERVGPELRARLLPAGPLEAAVRDVDIVTAATTSPVPVLDGAAVRAGTHVNGVGSYRPAMREFDQTLIARSAVYVESRATALAEAGELIAAVAAGVTDPAGWHEIGDLEPPFTRAAAVTFFKSVGHAVFDLFAARAVSARAVADGLGTEWLP